MGARVGPRSPGVFESRAGVLSEIDHALAVFGAAHWAENFSTGANPRGGRKNSSRALAERPVWVSKLVCLYRDQAT